MRLRFLLAVAVAVAVDFFHEKPQELKFLACCGFGCKTATSAAIPTKKTETEKVSSKYTGFQVLPGRLGSFFVNFLGGIPLPCFPGGVIPG